jgi:transcriptional regulator with XRE-family HTH domain
LSTYFVVFLLLVFLLRKNNNMCMNTLLFAQRLSQLRKEANLSQIKLGEAIGVSRFTIIDWEAGRKSPNAKHLEELAQALKAPISYLLGETDTPSPPGAREAAQPPQKKSPKLEDHLRAVSSAGMDVTPIPVVTKEIKVCCGNGNTYPLEVEWELSGEYCFVYDKDLMGYSWQCDSFRVIIAEGDSMEPRIQDGDYLIFAMGAQAGDGDVAVIRYAGRLMIRGLLFSPDGAITMHPFNKSYQDKAVEEDAEFYILGVVIGKAPKPEIQPIGRVF